MGKWRGWTATEVPGIALLLSSAGFTEVKACPLAGMPGRWGLLASGPGFRALYWRPSDVMAVLPDAFPTLLSAREN